VAAEGVANLRAFWIARWMLFGKSDFSGGKGHSAI